MYVPILAFPCKQLAYRSSWHHILSTSQSKQWQLRSTSPPRIYIFESVYNMQYNYHNNSVLRIQRFSLPGVWYIILARREIVEFYSRLHGNHVALHKQLGLLNYPGENKTSNFILSFSTTYQEYDATGYKVIGIYPLQNPLIMISVRCCCIASCICAEDSYISLSDWL